MKTRSIILTIDTICELFKDYLDPEDLPANAQPTKMLLNPAEKGKIAIEFFDLSWPEGLEPLQVNFHIKRLYGV